MDAANNEYSVLNCFSNSEQKLIIHFNKLNLDERFSLDFATID